MIKSDSNPHPLCDAPKIKATTMHLITAESFLSALEVDLKKGLLGLVHIRVRLDKISVMVMVMVN